MYSREPMRPDEEANKIGNKTHEPLRRLEF
jgi:hypothetical protein